MCKSVVMTAGVFRDDGVERVCLRVAGDNSDSHYSQRRRPLGSYSHVPLLPAARHHRVFDGQGLLQTRQAEVHRRRR